MATSIKNDSLQHEILTASIPLAQIPLFLRDKLNPLLPYSLPLYRRCQWFLHQCTVSPQQGNHDARQGEAEIWIALAIPKPTTAPTRIDWLTSWLQTPYNRPSSSGSEVPRESGDQYSEEWLACHLDLREPGQTQVWSFGSWEAAVLPKLMSESSSSEDVYLDPSPSQIALGRALFHRLRSHHIPALSPTPSAQYLTMKAAGKIVSSPFKRSKVLFGTIAEASWWMLEDNIVKESTTSQQSSDSSPSNLDSSTVNRTTRIAREDRPYLKYLLPLPLPDLPSTDDSPGASLTAKPLATNHIQTVLDNSTIPRTLELLQSLVTVGLFPSSSSPTASSNDPDPISWGILSKDASLSSLHTEPKYRGQRLAERVARELIARTGERFRTDSKDAAGGQVDIEVPWAHTDVSTSNIASQRVFEKMGARIGWRVGWVEVDVGEEIPDGNGEVV